MNGRSLLGQADVSEETLAAMVADLLGHDIVELLESTAELVDYDVGSLTTAGRYWVSGVARTPVGKERYRLFVKHVQAVSRSPFFAHLPAQMRDSVASSFPWRIEAAVYRSDLAQRLPEGLSMPRAVGVFDLDPESVVIWIEAVRGRAANWSPEQYERAAYLLGRLSANPEVRELSDVGKFAWDVMSYVSGRLLLDVIPGLERAETWRQPQIVAEFGEDLRDRMRVAGGLVEAYGRELLAMPHLVSHGDASPNNLLPGDGPGEIVLLDFALWLSKPIGFDLGQLIAGEVQLGRLPAMSLETLDERCVVAYSQGLADEGLDIDLDLVRRSHALQLFLFSGVSALPDQEMFTEQVAARALLARHSLDLLDRTG